MEQIKNLLKELAAALQKATLPQDFESKLYTVCSHLQGQVERAQKGESRELVQALRETLSLIAEYLPLCRDAQLRDYLLLINRDFHHRVNETPEQWNNIRAETYGQYSSRTLRTGWVKRGVPNPESVAEHMYNTWLMGMLLLPEECASEPDYRKEQVLELVLLHDIAEAVTGDIDKPTKDQSPKYYQAQEETEMAICLLRSTYPSMPSQKARRKLWQEWYNPQTVNGRLARELDLIQTMYQMLTYAKAYPACFVLEDMCRWMTDREKIHTEIGQGLLTDLVLENRAFSEILSTL